MNHIFKRYSALGSNHWSTADNHGDTIMYTHSSQQPTSLEQAIRTEYRIRESDIVWLRRGQSLGEALLAVLSSPETGAEPAVSNEAAGKM